MVSEFRTFTVGDKEVTDFRDGAFFIKDGEGATILTTIEELKEIIKEAEEGEWLCGSLHFSLGCFLVT